MTMNNAGAAVSIAIALSRSGRGVLAELRRMRPGQPPAPFWEKMAEYDLDPNKEEEWALVMQGIAIMTPREGSAHRDGMPVGRALYLGGERNRSGPYYSESRFNRLLNARGDALRPLLVRMFRMMASVGQPFDWREMASFVLHPSDAARNRLARNYYDQKVRSNNTASAGMDAEE